jgi:hypothetical protein
VILKGIDLKQSRRAARRKLSDWLAGLTLHQCVLCIVEEEVDWSLANLLENTTPWSSARPV